MTSVKIAYCLFCALSVLPINGAEKSDSSKVDFSGVVSLNSNGIASIPAFSLGKPALVSSLSVGKGRFSYDPTLAYALTMKPWFIDNWLHFKIINKDAFVLRLGWNFSTFLSETRFGEESILKGERYFAGEIAGIIKMTSNSRLTLMYWSDNGIEPGSISGHYGSITGEINNVNIGESLFFSGSVQLFYINYDGNNDGFFVSPRLAWNYGNLPLSLFFQASQVIQSNIEPSPGFRWNVGVDFSFN